MTPAILTLSRFVCPSTSISPDAVTLVNAPVEAELAPIAAPSILPPLISQSAA